MERDVTSAEMLSRLNQFIKERESEGAIGNNTTNWGLVKFREGVVENEINGDKDEIIDYIKSIKSRYKPSSVNRIANSIKVFSNWLKKRGYKEDDLIEKFPHKLVSVPKKPIVTFTDEDYERLKLAAEGTSLYYLIVAGWNTGMRLIDCATLKWKEIDLERKVIVRKPSKTEEYETVVEIPMSKELYNLLSEMILVRDSSDYLCEHLAFKAMAGDLSKHFRYFLNRNKLYDKGKTFHAFRRTAISRWLSHPNADIMTVRHLSGHKDVKSLIPYFHPSMDKKKLIMDIVE